MSDKTPEEKSRLVSTWADVESMIKAQAFPKWTGRALAGACIVLTVLIGIGAYNTGRINTLVHANHALVQQLHAGAITTCEAGNRARATNKLIWDEFLTLAVKNPNTVRERMALEYEISKLNLPVNRVRAFDLIINAVWASNPADVKLVHQFENYIAAHEYPVNCARAYDP